MTTALSSPARAAHWTATVPRVVYVPSGRGHVPVRADLVCALDTHPVQPGQTRVVFAGASVLVDAPRLEVAAALGWGPCEDDAGPPSPPADQAPATAEEWAERVGAGCLVADHEYGSQWQRRGYQIGTWANVARKGDRLRRQTDLGRSPAQMRDTLADLAGYCGLYLAGRADGVTAALQHALRLPMWTQTAHHACVAFGALAAAHDADGAPHVTPSTLECLYASCAAACLRALAAEEEWE